MYVYIYMFGCVDFTRTHIYSYIEIWLVSQSIKQKLNNLGLPVFRCLTRAQSDKWISASRCPNLFAPPLPCTWVFSSMEWWLGMCLTRAVPELSVWESWFLEQAVERYISKEVQMQWLLPHWMWLKTII